MWKVGEGGGAVCPFVLGCRRSRYSAALASAPSALPSTSSSEQSPVPFRTIRRVTTKGMSPRLWTEAEGQWGPAKEKRAAQYTDFKVSSRGKEARDHPCQRLWTIRATRSLTCFYYKAPAEGTDGGRRSSSLTSRQGGLGLGRTHAQHMWDPECHPSATKQKEISGPRSSWNNCSHRSWGHPLIMLENTDEILRKVIFIPLIGGGMATQRHFNTNRTKLSCMLHSDSRQHSFPIGHLLGVQTQASRPLTDN